MITDLLLAVPWLVPLGLAAALALGPLLGWWLVDRPRIAWALAGLSIVPVAVLIVIFQERVVSGLTAGSIKG